MVSDPLDWIIQLHGKIQESYSAIRALATHIEKTRIQHHPEYTEEHRRASSSSEIEELVLKCFDDEDIRRRVEKTKSAQRRREMPPELATIARGQPQYVDGLDDQNARVRSPRERKRKASGGRKRGRGTGWDRRRGSDHAPRAKSKPQRRQGRTRSDDLFFLLISSIINANGASSATPDYQAIADQMEAMTRLIRMFDPPPSDHGWVARMSEIDKVVSSMEGLRQHLLWGLEKLADDYRKNLARFQGYIIDAQCYAGPDPSLPGVGARIARSVL
ncbi:hypothetical protein F4679DRAFT_597014 [Xylaria curta]|nr:hypothetical protein F4679DRAFT_597014 [Xylaria curta]